VEDPSSSKKLLHSYRQKLYNLLAPTASPSEMLRLSHAFGQVHQSLGQLEEAATFCNDVPGDAPMTLHLYTVVKDASDFVLTTFQRIEGGDAIGDPKVIGKVRHMFFRI
jgi:hypothetical protein